MALKKCTECKKRVKKKDEAWLSCIFYCSGCCKKITKGDLKPPMNIGKIKLWKYQLK